MTLEQTIGALPDGQILLRQDHHHDGWPRSESIFITTDDLKRLVRENREMRSVSNG